MYLCFRGKIFKQMKNYKLINNVGGWAVFLIAALTYLFTIEPITSFWDCGEFITTAYKLEVGHPPGAPLFMLIGRFFTLFSFGDTSLVALSINVLSALVSAFTILFLFWSITHIAKRIIAKTNEITKPQLIAILGSGAVGALVYTFSDSFWFSAVEGEVYATSSFFTAVVFWAILKWENEADQKYSNRWLILIAYLMGLSIGIHLLNLLTIPAIVFVYYFKKYKVTRAGVIKTSILAIGLLGIVMYGVIQGFVVFGSWFERIFTNSFGLPYNTGFLFYLVILLGGLIYGIYYSLKKQKVILNTIFTAVLVILIGYSSFTIILVRSLADTPMNQNKPDDIFALISYLNREQYGDRPLMYGQHFNASVVQDESGSYTRNVKANYVKRKDIDKYEIVDYKIERNYDSKYKTFFPRMYSDSESPDHIHGYLYWINEAESEFYKQKKNEETGEFITTKFGEPVYDRYNPKRAPSFGENLEYFFKYQLNFMYLRYFWWNFAGKQNDIQGHGGIRDGNWISGINFIDELRLGEQDKLPKYLKDNKARNKYYFLPFILGIIGILFMLKSGQIGKNYFWVVMLFFFFTGVAIVIYLNQPPRQPRERDYAYAASFYAFAIFIGFGVAGIYKFLKNKIPAITAAGIAVLFGIGVPTLMAQQNWDDHDRSDRYTASDYAKNYLQSCEKNAIIFTNGDNDTFPLWYIQEVEGFRTDVRVINLSYFNTDWYINQMIKKAYDSEPVPFSLTPDKYKQGTRDIIYKSVNQNIYLTEKYQANKFVLEAEYKKLFDELITFLGNSNFKIAFAKNYETLIKGHTSLSPQEFYGFITRLTDQKTIEQKSLNYNIETIKEYQKKALSFLKKISEQPLPLKTFIKHIGSEKKADKAPMGDGDYVNYMPSTKFVIPLNKKELIENGIVQPEDKDDIENSLVWDIRKGHIRKNDMMVLDMLATNNWERPIYFATTVGRSNYMKLEQFFQLEGLAYRILPVKAKNVEYIDEGRVNSNILYHNIMEKFVWGGLEKNPEKLYLDENNRRFLMNFKSSFKSLAGQLIHENKLDSATNVLNKCTSLFTNEMSPFGYYDLLIADMYYKIHNKENPEDTSSNLISPKETKYTHIDKKFKADSIIKIATNNFTEEFKYYFSLNKKYLSGISEDMGRTAALAQEAIRILNRNGNELAQELAMTYIQMLDNKFSYAQAFEQTASSPEAQNNWYMSLPEYEQRLVSFYMSLKQIIGGMPVN